MMESFLLGFSPVLLILLVVAVRYAAGKRSQRKVLDRWRGEHGLAITQGWDGAPLFSHVTQQVTGRIEGQYLRVEFQEPSGEESSTLTAQLHWVDPGAWEDKDPTTRQLEWLVEEEYDYYRFASQLLAHSYEQMALDPISYERSMGACLLSPGVAAATERLALCGVDVHAGFEIDFDFRGDATQIGEVTDAILCLARELIRFAQAPGRQVRALLEDGTTDQKLYSLEVQLLCFPQNQSDVDFVLRWLLKETALPLPLLQRAMELLTDASFQTNPLTAQFFEQMLAHPELQVRMTAMVELQTEESTAQLLEILGHHELPEGVHRRVLKKLVTHPSKARFEGHFRKVLSEASPPLRATAADFWIEDLCLGKEQRWPVYREMVTRLSPALERASLHQLTPLLQLLRDFPQQVEGWKAQLWDPLLSELWKCLPQIEPDSQAILLDPRFQNQLRSVLGQEGWESLVLQVLRSSPERIQLQVLELLGSTGSVESIVLLEPMLQGAYSRDLRQALLNTIEMIKLRVDPEARGGLSMSMVESNEGQLSLAQGEGQLSLPERKS